MRRSSSAACIPDDSPAIEAGLRSQELFSVPLTADTAVVERDEHGLSRRKTQEAIVQRAVDATSQETGGDEIQFALPILNTDKAFPGLRGGRDDRGHAPLLPARA